MKRWIPLLILLAALVAGSSVYPYSSIFIRTVLDDETQSAARTTLGLGTGDSPQFAEINLDTILLLEQSSDPAVPSDGEAVMWMSDGTGFGDDGDVCMGITAGGSTTRIILYDHSSGGAW